MDKNDITQMRLAEIAGVEPATVSGWMNEKSDPRRYYLEKIADYFNVSVDDLRSEGHGLAAKQRGSYITPVPVDSYAPVIGYVPAGDPYEATEIEGELHWVDPDVRSKHPKAFFLIISGDSMDKVFDDGRYVLIDPDGDPHDKDIVAVIVNGDEATIKRIFFAGDVIVLHPDSTNGKHKARTIDVSNPDAPPVRILGVAVWDVPAKSGPYR
jgi:repressor LexA